MARTNEQHQETHDTDLMAPESDQLEGEHNKDTSRKASNADLRHHHHHHHKAAGPTAGPSEDDRFGAEIGRAHV